MPWPPRGTIDHIDLTVRDPRASRAFYDAVLGFLGYRLASEHDRGFDWDLRDETGGLVSSIGIMRATGDGLTRKHDRTAPGLHHIAWRAESRNDVARLHDLLVAIGAEILDPPADYPDYAPCYHAVFFADPDGLKLEFVFQP
ncbi:VOC family protein [Bauldia litoralis]|uniref:VOC family protein n=1 Tax=Bauldia litoralis TaxID=665467 RepID=UPI0032657874